MITDLSFPKGKSANDRIPDCNSVVTFAGIPEAIFTIVKVGKGALLARFDIQRAYRLLPVSAAHRHLLGMSWKGSFYVDLALPFALRSAPKIFTCFADSLQWIFSRKGGVENVQHYLDDFLLVGPPGSKKCQDELSTCLDFSALLGVPIANDKTEGPAARLTFLGFELDTVTQELRLPESKLERFVVSCLFGVSVDQAQNVNHYPKLVFFSIAVRPLFMGDLFSVGSLTELIPFQNFIIM